MIRLTCSSCGAKLELPGNIDVASCLYCGTKVLLPHTDARGDRQKLGRYLELCRLAVEARDYDEALTYCNKALELDAGSLEALVTKAVCTFWLCDDEETRYERAAPYLRRAERIDPASTTVNAAWEDMEVRQAEWYNGRGTRLLERVAGSDDAPGYIEAMDCFLEASRYRLEDVATLENIDHCAEMSIVAKVKWNNEVRSKQQILRSLRQKAEATRRLPHLTAQLHEARKELHYLRSETGLLSGMRLKAAELRFGRLQADIKAKTEEAAYEIPEDRKSGNAEDR